MAVFYDDFERANGALGGNWTVTFGSVTINGGYAGNVSAGEACNTTVSDINRLTATSTFIYGLHASYFMAPAVKASPSEVGCYTAALTWSAGTYTFRLARYAATSLVALATTTWAGAAVNLHTISVTWDQGALSATCDGAHELTANDSTYNTHNYGGIVNYSNAWALADVRIVGGAAVGLAVDPTAIGNYGACSTVTLTGTNTAWTPGTPGTPTFTVDHGTISAQEVTSSTSATLTYCPGDYLGTVTFTDPSTGATATALVTSDPNIVPPTGAGCLLTEDGAAMVNMTADHTTGDLTTSDMIVGLGIGGAPNLTLVQALADLWYAEFRTAINPPSGYQGSDVLSKLWLIINGGWDPAVGPWPEPSASTLKQDTEGAVASLAALRTGHGYTLDDVFTLLGGFPLLSHQDLKTAIDNVQVGSNQDVLDMLTAMWGASTPTLTQIATLISDLATIAGYTLGDVLDAIAAQDVHGHTEQVLAAIAALRGDNSSTVAGSYSLLVGMNVALQEVRDSLREIRAPSAYTFQDVLDAIAAIPAGGDGGTAGPPVWPGTAGVTIGPAWPLSTGLTVTAPMDGVVVEIVAVAPKLNGHLYTYHDIACYRNVGALAFVSDRGDVETYQALGFTQAIYTPRYLKRAAAVKIMTPAGTAGSVRAWTVNP